MLRNDDALAVAERLSRAVSDRDLEAMREIYAEDLVFVMYTGDATPKTREEHLESFAHMIRRFHEFSIEITDRLATDAGYVSLQVLDGTTTAGTHVRVPHCFIAKVDDGRITRVDEYIDAAALAPAMEAPPSQ